MDNSAYPNNQFIFDKGSSSQEYFVPFHQIEKARKLIMEVKRLKVLLDFNGYYISYLLGCTTEKDFEKILKRFSVA